MVGLHLEPRCHISYCKPISVLVQSKSLYDFYRYNNIYSHTTRLLKPKKSNSWKYFGITSTFPRPSLHFEKLLNVFYIASIYPLVDIMISGLMIFVQKLHLTVFLRNLILSQPFSHLLTFTFFSQLEFTIIS